MTNPKSLLTWRAARWAVLAAAIPALWACNSRRLAKPEPAPQMQFNDLFQQAVNRNIDIVFMVDDSSSMAPIQAKLTAQFPAFMDVLKGLPGGLPNVHIGVVSSSMGAGRNPSIDHCPQGGDQGVFHTKPLGTTCGKGMLNPNQNFIINVNGAPNYTGDISDVFSCIALLGDGGCGFEHQFESVLRALGADGAMAPPANANFLRPDAYLAVVMITNEDDCSAPPDSDLFDSSSSTVTDPLGPLQSYRCNEFGHLCGGQPPPRQPPGEVDLSGMCVSAENGRLLKVSDVVAAMKGLKKDPSKVLVAAIAGPPSPYKVNIGPSQVKGDPSQWPYVEHSCTQMEPNNDITYADPSIRIKQWIDAFGANGVFEDMCAPDFKLALQAIATTIGKKIGSPCVYGPVLDTDGVPWNTGSMTTPDCTVIDHSTSASSGNVVDTRLPPCDNMAQVRASLKMNPPQPVGTTACWVLDDSTTATCPTAPISHVMLFNRPGGAVTTDLNSSVSCSVLTCPTGTTLNAAGTKCQ
jgi:hypothetical protein